MRCQGTATCGTMICTGRLRFSCWKPARRLAWRSSSACAAARSAPPSSGPSSTRAPVAPCRRRAPAHHKAHGTAAPPARATAAGRPRSADSAAPAARSPPATAPATADRAGCGRRPQLRRMAHQRLQRRKPALRQVTHLLLREQRRRPRPGRASAPHPAGPSSVSAFTSSACASGIAGSPPLPKRRRLRRCTPVRRSRASRKAPQIVEADLRPRKAAQAAMPSPG